MSTEFEAVSGSFWPILMPDFRSWLIYERIFTLLPKYRALTVGSEKWDNQWLNERGRKKLATFVH